MKLLFICTSLLFIMACTQEEGKINKRQRLQIQRVVEYKIDSVRKAQQAICYESVLKIAKPKADSIILAFEYEAINEELDKPDKPLKPKKPEVEIPVFED